ncbi:MAG: DNA-3-methyladenine glycosylase 2 family protein [Rhizobiaceae bacterium]|nr:DNA-3-methyladenine glycosylase 2 family protein [Rhizobiaceae bacterium]
MRRIDSEQDIADGLAELAALDPRLPAIIAGAGTVDLRRRPAGFEAMVAVVTGQQVSRASADAIFGRLKTLVDPITAAAILAGGEALLRQAGYSRPKIATLLKLSETVSAGAIDLDAVADLPSGDALPLLTALHGIGPWTAEVYLLFAAGHADVFPAGDLALQIAAQDAFALAGRPDAKAMRQMAESWSPWRSVAARLLWAHYREMRGRDATPAP